MVLGRYDTIYNDGCRWICDDDVVVQSNGPINESLREDLSYSNEVSEGHSAKRRRVNDNSPPNTGHEYRINRQKVGYSLWI